MADTKITGLTELTEPSLSDMFYAVDISDISQSSSGSSKQVSLSGIYDGFTGNININTVGTIESGTWEATPILDQYLEAHSFHHMSGSGDQILLDNFGECSDTTARNALYYTHGLCPKLSNSLYSHLNGAGQWIEDDVENPIAIRFVSTKFSGSIAVSVKSSTGKTLMKSYDGSIEIKSTTPFSSSFFYIPCSGSSPKEIYLHPVYDANGISPSGYFSNFTSWGDNKISYFYGGSGIETFALLESPLSFFNFRKYSKDTAFSLSEMSFTEVDITNMGEMSSTIEIYDGDITEIHASGTSISSTISVVNNNMSKQSIESFLMDLDPFPEEGTLGYIYIGGNPGTATTDETIATSKGYTVFK